LRPQKIGWINGILIDTGHSRLLFDQTAGRPSRRNVPVFITHAHSDHTYGFTTRAEKHSTLSTVQIYQALVDRQVQNVRVLNVGDRIKIDDCEIRALNAGHMLGSCQYEIASSEFTAVYTGDINCVDTLTTEAADVASCDCLIIEATYGHPSYVFPRRSTMYADIVSWAMSEISEGKIPAFQVYSSGKPQEVIRLFNVYTKIPVICSPTIASASRVHTENGVKLEYLESALPDGKKMLEAGGCVYVTSSRRGFLPRNASRAFATGWALRHSYRDSTSFPLSSHADHDQLLEYVKKTNPRRVYVFTGYSDVLAMEIERKLGIKAAPLPVVAQTKLHDFSERIT